MTLRLILAMICTMLAMLATACGGPLSPSPIDPPAVSFVPASSGQSCDAHPGLFPGEQWCSLIDTDVEPTLRLH